ncbi:hypothetical protein FPOAC2_13785 [Fusarium poae]|jgi:hypothetical protein
MEPPPNLEWHTAHSAHGKEYQFAYDGPQQPSIQPRTGSLIQPRMTREPFDITVNWVPTYDADWEPASDEVKSRAAITERRVARFNGTYYSYIIEFVNTEHYNYHFWDETGDSYSVNTFTNGHHYVRYNSEKPTIISISGT